MSWEKLVHDFINDMKGTTWYEYVAVFSGIASVWYSRKENILVYPVGLINTLLYIFISLKGGLGGEATVNLYYTIMSVYGWYLWTRKNKEDKPRLLIKSSTAKEWEKHL